MVKTDEFRLHKKEYMRQYRIIHPGLHLKRTYGITATEYGELLVAQGGKCVICGADNSGIKNKNGEYRPMCVDHDHKTGKIRGLLCTRCNLLLGNARDNEGIFSKLVDYLYPH